MTTRLAYGNMLAAQLPSGVSPEEWAGLALRFADVHAAFRREVSAGTHGFVELVQQREEHERVRAWAASVRGRYDDVVVLGIGGSALGTSLLQTALLPHAWNELSATQRAGAPRLHVLDNVDPRTIAARLALLSLERTLFLVVSKSGGTAETLAQYLLVRSRVESARLRVNQHLAFVTDPTHGLLRPIAERDTIPAFSIPPNVGGRFSVLTPVGTLAAALVGIDTEALLRGAAAAAVRAAESDLARNFAGVFATLQWRAHRDAGQGIHVMMSYSDALRGLAPWFVQLWAESLGKVDVDGKHSGPTPLAAVGATDQHSQIQLYMEGPRDKTVTFVTERSRDADVTIPVLAGAPEESAYLQGRSFGTLLDTEQRATAAALAQADRPNMTISVERCDAEHVGELLMMLMHATVFAGALYQVNPLGQPGVERGKVLTREGLESGQLPAEPDGPVA